MLRPTFRTSSSSPRSIGLTALLYTWLGLFSLTLPAWVLADNHRFATVPALANVSINGKEGGSLHYIVIQLDSEPQRRGPTIQFTERALGSAVSDDWKAGARVAVLAAADLVGEDPKMWMLTIKNAAYTIFNKGSSASSVIAVGVMAAARGDSLKPGVAMTGVVTRDGRISEVGGLPGKLEGAAAGKIHTLLIPRGQGRTSDGDLFEQGRQRNVTVIEVSSLREAYELMTGKKP
jgi:predicted S18 family serine protease